MSYLMTLTLEIPHELEKRLEEKAKNLGVLDSDVVLRAIEALLGDRGNGEISPLEMELLSEIDRGFSDAWWNRYGDLVNKREAQMISRDEHRELSEKTEALEEYNVRRISCLAGAAKRHGLNIQELMDQLGLKPRGWEELES